MGTEVVAMRRTLAGTAGTWLAAWAALTAADFWQEKDFTAWTAQQVEEMLTDSPWARKVTVVIGSLREEALGGFRGGGAGLDGGGGGRQREGGAQVQRVRRLTVTIAWLSASPVRQALARLESGQGTRISPDDPELSQDEPSYTVAVVGLPVRGRALPLGTIDEIKARTALKPAGKDRIPPEDVRVLAAPAWLFGPSFKDGDQFVRVEFRFPRTSPIALDDKEVEFSTKLGDVELTKKFKLADMMVRGRLAL
jgi:hypothetical protein